MSECVILTVFMNSNLSYKLQNNGILNHMWQVKYNRTIVKWIYVGTVHVHCVCAEKWSDDGMVVATKWMMIKAPWRIQTSVKYPGKKPQLVFFSSLEIINCIILYSGVFQPIIYNVWVNYVYICEPVCVFVPIYIVIHMQNIWRQT